ncbi:MAG: CBS domain-containing protein [Butyricicoccaceae bacterium]
MSLRRAWDYMNENDIQTLAVVDEDRHLNGLLTLSDIARFYMEDQDANALAEAKTSYRNLVDVLTARSSTASSSSRSSRAASLLRRRTRMFSRTTSRRTTWSSSAIAMRASAPSK